MSKSKWAPLYIMRVYTNPCYAYLDEIVKLPASYQTPKPSLTHTYTLSLCPQSSNTCSPVGQPLTKNPPPTTTLSLLLPQHLLLYPHWEIFLSYLIHHH